MLNETNTRRTGVDENVAKRYDMCKARKGSQSQRGSVDNVIARSATSDARMIREI